MNAEKILAKTFADHEHLAPDAASVLAEIRRRLPGQTRGRARWLTAVGAAAAVAVIAIVTTLLVGRAQRAAPTAPANHVLTLLDKIGRFGTPIGGRFVDRQHGFVALHQCQYTDLTAAESVDPKFQNTCRDVLEATSDGGATFQRRALPANADLGGSTRVVIFDATHLAVIQEAVGGTAGGKPVNIPAARWISSDAGLTWRPVGLQPGDAVSEIPAGAVLLSYLPDETGPPAVITPDGVIHPLTPTSPVTTTMQSGPSLPWWALTQAGGSYFYYPFGGSDPTTGLLISRDKGRTWQPVDLPAGIMSPLVIGSDGSWTYARAESTSGTPGSLIASHDGGRTWKLLTLPTAASRAGGWPGVAPVGGLLFDDGTSVWHNSGVGAFTRIPDTTRTQWLTGLGPVVVAIRITPDGDITLATTVTGMDWRNATLD